MPKLPLPPTPQRLASQPLEIAIFPTDRVLWRVHFTSSPHATAWDGLRRYGPVATCRFDPHVPPPHLQAEGVAYTAADVPTALAEVFQATRIINRNRAGPYLTGFEPDRPLQLLDLTGSWPVRLGASHAINTGRKDHCRAWARALRAAWPDVDGILHSSAMTGAQCVTLFSPAEKVFPRSPAFSEPLSHQGLAGDLTAVALTLGCGVI